MKHYKKVINKIFVLPLKYVFLICFISFPLVIYSLNNLKIESILSYISYILSFYALIVLCISLPKIRNNYIYYISNENLKIIKIFKKLMFKNIYTKRYWEDKYYRVLVSLYSGLFINLIYALFRIITGYSVKSKWFIAIGIYYLIFSFIRFILIKNYNLSKEGIDKRLTQYKTYKNTGIMILILNISMIGMIIQMIYKNETYVYSGLLIYASAIFTFYITISAIIEVYRFRKVDNQILLAAKNLNLVGSIMSVFTLQTAMLYVFGTRNTSNMQMNMITGSVVSILVILLAIYMIFRGNKLITKIDFKN
ncbi:MAG: hypothetical protein ACK5HP_03345 [Bacilli bacterium]